MFDKTKTAKLIYDSSFESSTPKTYYIAYLQDILRSLADTIRETGLEYYQGYV